MILIQCCLHISCGHLHLCINLSPHEILHINKKSINFMLYLQYILPIKSWFIFPFILLEFLFCESHLLFTPSSIQMIYSLLSQLEFYIFIRWSAWRMAAVKFTQWVSSFQHWCQMNWTSLLHSFRELVRCIMIWYLTSWWCLHTVVCINYLLN